MSLKAGVSGTLRWVILTVTVIKMNIVNSDPISTRTMGSKVSPNNPHLYDTQ